MKGKNNVLLVEIDCLREDFINGNGDRAYTPNIDKLVKDGFSFLNTIACTSTTVPNFTSLLTGLYPFEHGVRTQSGYSLRSDAEILTQLMRKDGYNTYSEFTGPLVKEIGLSSGFDEYNYRDSGKNIHTSWGRELKKKVKSHYREPWFIGLHLWALHLPRRIIRSRRSRKYGKTIYGRSLSSIDKFFGELFELLPENTLVILTGDHGERIARSAFEYYKKRAVKFLFKNTRKMGFSRRFFLRGIREQFVGHGYSIYDELLKIPFLISGLEGLNRRNSDIQIRQIDIMPTVLDICGISCSEEVTGKSALPVIKGEDNEHRDAYIEAVGTIIPSPNEWLAGLRIDNKYKFIYAPFREDYPDELYLLEEDPGEEVNRASEHPELVSEFKERIEGMKTEKMVGEKIDEETRSKIEKNLKALGYMD